MLSRGIYRGLCLSCSGPVEDSLLILGIPLCRRCLEKLARLELLDSDDVRRLIAVLEEYESTLFVMEWLKSVKDIVVSIPSASRDALEALSKIVGAAPGLESVSNCINDTVSKLSSRAKVLETELSELASRVRERIWSIDLSKLANERWRREIGEELSKLIYAKRIVESFEKFFEICVGNKPWNIQRAWMYRVVERQSFAMIAPTGVGKTTFGLVSALYLALFHELLEGRKFRTYIIVPTRVLVKQYFERVVGFIKRLKERIDEVVEVFSSMGVEIDASRMEELLEIVEYGVVSIPPQPVPGGTKPSRVAVEERILRGDFYILITTSAYVHSKFSRFAKRGGNPLSMPFLWAFKKSLLDVVREACSTEAPSRGLAKKLYAQVCADEESMTKFVEELRNVKVDYAFVDDVDAIMKGSKLIDYVLQLVGFDMNLVLQPTTDENGRRIHILKIVESERARQLREFLAKRDIKSLCSEARRRGERVLVPKFDIVESIIGKNPSDRELADVMDVLRRYGARIDRSSPAKFVRTLLITYAHRLTEELIESRRIGKGIVVVSSATGRARGRRIRFFRYLLGFDIGGKLELYRKILDVYLVIGSENFEEKALAALTELVKELGSGGLVFVPVDKGVEFVDKIVRALRDAGIRAEGVTAKKPSLEVIDRFRSGEIDVLVGVAIYYGLLVRGLDIPERVRYAIFVGVPRHKVNISRVEYSPTTLMRILGVLVEVVPEREREKIQRYMVSLRRVLRTLSVSELRMLTEKVSQGVTETPYQQLVAEIHDYVQNLLQSSEILNALKNNPNIAVVEEEGVLYMLIPDAPTYIQASGRTSRLFAGGITQGISLVLVDDERLLRGLEKRMRMYIDDFSFKPWRKLKESSELRKVLEEVDRDRELVRKVISGELFVRGAAPMELVKTVLIVVESPNKARTIARFFGRPSYRDLGPLRAYEVDLGNMHLVITASGGHVYDVVEYGDFEEGLGISGDEAEIFGVKLRLRRAGIGHAIPSFIPVYGAMKRCLICGKQFLVYEHCPRCQTGLVEVGEGERVERIALVEREDREGALRARLMRLTKNSMEVVNVLKRLAMEVDEVLIGTDPDAEGEKIGFDLSITLAPFAKSIRRMEFHEVTRKAILRALEELRGIDINMVEAQIARRVEDRWIGFALSDYLRIRIALLARKVVKTLSAGRVQTPTLGYVVRRHYLHDVTESKYLRLQLQLPDSGRGSSVYISRDAIDGFEKLERREEHEVVLELVEEEDVELLPPPPFTTDELLVEASTRFRMSVERVMAIAQQLFEMGLITYHRTDSTRVSDAGIAVARQYLESAGMSNLFKPRSWTRGVVGAHECIRPTRPIDASKLRELVAEGVLELPQRLTDDHYRVYDLIFRRFIASQMKELRAKRLRYVVKEVDGVPVKERVKVVKTVVGEFEVPLVTDVEVFVVPEEEMASSFLSVYEPLNVAGRVVRSHLGKEVKVSARKIRVASISLRVRLPNEGDIVKWMKSWGVGRPSTYAKIVATLFDRRYIKRVEAGVVIATDRGRLVYTMLAGGALPPDDEPSLEEYENKIMELLSRMNAEEYAKMIMSILDPKRALALEARFGTTALVAALDSNVCSKYLRRGRAREWEGELRCEPILRVIELSVARTLYELVSVRTTANLVRAMEEIESGKRFYHTVLEHVLAEIIDLFDKKLAKVVEELPPSERLAEEEHVRYVVERSRVYGEFVEKVKSHRDYASYLSFLSSFRESLSNWLSKAL